MTHKYNNYLYVFEPRRSVTTNQKMVSTQTYSEGFLQCLNLRTNKTKLSNHSLTIRSTQKPVASVATHVCVPMLIAPLHLAPGLPDTPHHGLLQCVGSSSALGPVHVGGHVGQADVELGVPLQRATCHREVLVTPLLYDHHLDCGAPDPGPARPAPLHHVHPALAEVGLHEAAE